MMLIFALVRPLTFSCSSETHCCMADMYARTEKDACYSLQPDFECLLMECYNIVRLHN